MKIPGVHTCIYLFSLIIISTLTFGCQKKDPVELPTLDTIEITEITTKTAKSGGNIADDGGSTVTARGVEWSTSENPAVDSNDGKTSDGDGDGEFESTLSDLLPGTTYYVRAYAVYPHANIEGLSSDAEVLEAYGALYNWYAVETGNLCPTGWRVPSNRDWSQLANYLISNYEHITSNNEVARVLKSCHQVNAAQPFFTNYRP